MLNNHNKKSLPLTNLSKHHYIVFSSKNSGVNAAIIVFVFVFYRILFVLYCIFIALYCICIVLYFSVFYCILLYFIVFYCILLYFIVFYCILLYFIVFYCIVLFIFFILDNEQVNVRTHRGQCVVVFHTHSHILLHS